MQIAVASENEIRAAIAKHYRGQTVPATRRQDNRARDAHIAATSGEVFELDMTRAPGEGQVAASQAWMNRPPSANTMLDEFLEEEPAAGSDGFTPEELARIDAAVENQAKAAAILRALQALLTEKGYLR